MLATRIESVTATFVEDVNTASLESFVGYNSKRVTFVIMNDLRSKLQNIGLQRPIDYSVLDLVGHNPGITSRQLCQALNISPPNLVGIARSFEDSGLIDKRVQPFDRRAQGLYLTKHGLALLSSAEAVVSEVDIAATHALNTSERAQLNALLLKIYTSNNPIKPCWD